MAHYPKAWPLRGPSQPRRPQGARDGRAAGRFRHREMC